MRSDTANRRGFIQRVLGGLAAAVTVPFAAKAATTTWFGEAPHIRGTSDYVSILDTVDMRGIRVYACCLSDEEVRQIYLEGPKERRNG